MMILDTNVLSALMSRLPDERVVEWLDRQPRATIWTTSVTVLEVRLGLQTMPVGKRQAALMQAFETVLTHKIERRIAPFDAAAAQHAADLMAARNKTGRPADLRDTMIAGIALACQASLATRNVSHFDDLSVPVINPSLSE